MNLQKSGKWKNCVVLLLCLVVRDVFEIAQAAFFIYLLYCHFLSIFMNVTNKVLNFES